MGRSQHDLSALAFALQEGLKDLLPRRPDFNKHVAVGQVLFARNRLAANGMFRRDQATKRMYLI